MKRISRPEHVRELIQEQQSSARTLAPARRRVTPANPVLDSFRGCLSPESRRAESSPSNVRREVAVPDLHTTMAPEFGWPSAVIAQGWENPVENQTWDDIPATSGGYVPGIPMVQSADARHGHESGPGRVSSFDGSWGGRIFVQRIVDAVRMIVTEIFTNQPS